ncbi:MAG: AAA family ATPase, partial [Nocardioidaceae bacterium]
LYDWNYQRQLLAIRLAESQHERLTEADLFSLEFLQERPILRCVRYDGPEPPVLLIDEIDRADDEFEALLLEFLGEQSVTVPELGTFTAKRPPIVVLTSNRSRDLHDALRRRCLYHWLEFPPVERVVEILRRKVPSAGEPLIESAARFVGHVRDLDVDKAPGIAEAINWVAALSVLGVTELVRDDVVATLGTLAKTPDDRDLVLGSLDTVLG